MRPLIEQDIAETEKILTDSVNAGASANEKQKQASQPGKTELSEEAQ